MTNPEKNSKAERFPSFSAMRMRHNRLLKLNRETPTAVTFLDSVNEFILCGQLTGVILDTDEDRVAAQTLLDYWSSVLLRADREVPAPTLAEFDPKLEPSLSDDQCPYLQTSSIPPEKSNPYFGKQRLLRECLEHLQHNAILAVVGPVGSGRTSLVRDILIPELKAGVLKGSATWRYYPVLEPSEEPLASLTRTIAPDTDKTPNGMEKQSKAFRENPNHLIDLLDKERHPAVLVMDEFELILKMGEKEDSDAILSNLDAFGKKNETQNRIILIINSGNLNEHASAEVFRSGKIKQVFVAYDAHELRQAIEEPAKLVGLKFEEGLVDKLLLDVTGDPSAPTLLQFTLVRLWKHRRGNRITWEAYNQLRGGRLALALAAEELYGAQDERTQKVIQGIFMQIVRLGPDRELSRASVPVKFLHRPDDDRELIEPVLNKLSQAGLIRRRINTSGDGDSINLVHEALLSHWQRLAGWLDEERDTNRRRERLSDAAEQWLQRGRDANLLWRGSLLIEANEYKDIDDLEKKFLKAGHELESRERRKELRRSYAIGSIIVLTIILIFLDYFREAKIAQMKSEVKIETLQINEQVDKLQDEERAEKLKNEELQNDFLTATNSMLQATNELSRELIKSEAAENQKQEQLRRFALAQALAQESLNFPDERGELLASEAFLLNQQSQQPILPQIDQALRVVLSRPQVRVFHISQEFSSDAQSQPIFSIAFGGDSRTLSAASRSGDIFCWDIASNSAAHVVPQRKSTNGTFGGAVLNPMGQKVAGFFRANTNSEIVLQSATNTGLILWSAPAEKRGRSKLVFSPNGQSVAVGYQDGYVQIFRIYTNAIPPVTVRVGSNETPVMALSSGGEILATSGRDGIVHLWDARTGKPLFPRLNTLQVLNNTVHMAQSLLPFPSFLTLPLQANADNNLLQGPTNGVTAMSFGSNLFELAIGGGDGAVQIWTLGQTNSCTVLRGMRGGSVISSIAFNSTARYLAAGGWDGTVQVWDLSDAGTYNEPVVIRAHEGATTAVQFSPDSRWLAAGSMDKTVWLWQLPPPSTIFAATQARPRIMQARSDTALCSSFSGDGRTLAVGLWDGSIKIYRLDQTSGLRSPSLVLADGAPVLALALDKHGNILTTGDWYGSLRQWHLNAHDCTSNGIPGLPDAALSVATSPDGRIVAAGYMNGKVRIWDCFAKTNYIQDITNHTMGVNALAISEDGTKLVSGSWDGTVQCISLQSKTGLGGYPFNAHSIVTAVAFNPVNESLAIGTIEGTIFQKNLLGKDISLPLTPHEGGILSLSFSHNGRLLAAGNFDNSSQVWDVEKPTAQPKMRGYGSRVLSVGFSEDDQTVLSSSAEETMLSWIGPTEALSESTAILAKEARNSAGRELTPEEWSEYVGSDITNEPDASRETAASDPSIIVP